MNGYSNLGGACSSPPVGNVASRARRSLELTNTKETNAWEGLAIGAVTLARTFSTGSHRFSSSTRSGGGERTRSGGGLPSAVRRAFSMRRHPVGLGKADGHYWRIHDMDGDSDGDNEAPAGEEHDDDEDSEKRKKKKEQLAAESTDEKEAAGNASTATTATKKKRGGNILRACKKLLLRL